MMPIFFDFDDVIRFYPLEESAKIENRFSLPKGVIHKEAFKKKLLASVTTGEISRAQWINAIGSAIGSHDAAHVWDVRPIELDYFMIQLVKDLKQKGHPVHLLSNGTDNLRCELEVLGLSQLFLKVFNSAEIGFAKPGAKIFECVLEECNYSPENCMFIDDMETNIIAARNVGFICFHYNLKAKGNIRRWIEGNQNSKQYCTPDHS